MSVRDVVSTEISVSEGDVVEIRKYSNRRLYDTSASRYIKLTDVEEMIRQGQNIRVVDAQSGEDLTKSVMLQIICESKTQQEALPIGFLRQVIQASGKTVRNSLKEFLSMGLQAQRELQQQVSQWMKAGATFNPFLGPLTSLFGNTAQNPPPSHRGVTIRPTTEPATEPTSVMRDHVQENGTVGMQTDRDTETKDVNHRQGKDKNRLQAQDNKVAKHEEMIPSSLSSDPGSDVGSNSSTTAGRSELRENGADNHVQQEIEALRKQLALLQKQIDRIGHHK